MKKKIAALFASMLLAFQWAGAQNDSINAYLLTCEPGKAIYELYGHTAIWIQDCSQGTDAVFNYGLFDFNTPNFVMLFTLGKTDYLMGATRLQYFLREYRERGSEVYAQKLNLTPRESARLDSLLKLNTLPENRVYRYNFIFNNCATMALDKIEECIEGHVTYPQPNPSLTFRHILTEHTHIRPWSEFGVDLIVGAGADRPVGYRQEAFAPLYLKNLAAHATITDTAGTARPLVLPAIRLINPEHGVDFGNCLLTPVQLMWLVFMIVLLLTLLGWYNSKPLWMVDTVLFGIQGLGGIVIATLYFFSEHPTVNTNWLVICLNPLPLFLIPFMIHRIRRHRLSFFLLGEFIVCTAFLLFQPVIPQKIEPAVLILIATFALRALSSCAYNLYSSYRRKKEHTTNHGIYCILAALLLVPTGADAKTDKSPRLVVGIVVDQLDEECLEKLFPILSTDGLKKIWVNGYNRANATFDYEFTDRASAVASVYTGASPFQHGIVASRWMSHKTLIPVSPVDDGNHKGINTIEYTSPRNLLSTNLADELKLGSASRSKICSIAIERDAAVLAGGHDPDLTIWMNGSDCSWCSSDYYGALPQWVNECNDSLAKSMDWKPMLASGSYIQMSDHELFKPFSYTIKNSNPGEYRTTPYANDRITEIALSALKNMGLGNDDVPDLLALTYYAGNYKHTPNTIWSLEQQDIYVRLDQSIAALISAITSKVGIDNVLFFLTSTGYVENASPEFGGTRIPTGQVSMERTTALLNLYLGAKYGSGSYIESYYRNQIYLNQKLIEEKGAPMHEILESCVDLLVQVSGIRSVLLMRDLMSMIPDLETARKRNGYNSAYTGDIIIEAIPGWGISDEKDNSVTYRKPVSRPIPMILYGNGIRAEINHEPISVSVLAPTIAHITRNDPPNACSAVPLKNLK